MMDTRIALQAADTDPASPPQKLLVSGWIHLEPPGSGPVEVRREMIVLGRDGVTMGSVAAVVVDCATQATTHVLLGRLAPDLEYRLVPLSLIERVDEAAVRLRISSQGVSQLPPRPTT